MRRWLFAGAALLAAACTPVVTTSTNAPTTPSGDPVREEAIEDLEPVLRRDPALAPFLDDAVRRRIQILVAVPRDDGEPGLRRLGFRVDAEYFYPASAVKLAIATAALQKLDEASATPKTPLRVVEREGAQTRTIETTVADQVERALVVSDNEASNRLFELVGRDEINERLAQMGLASTRIVHRLGDPGERIAYAFELLPTNEPPVIVAQRIDYAPPPLPALDGLLVGTSYVDDDGRTVAAPMSFATKNRSSLRDLQALLVALVRPDLAPSIDLRLAASTRELLVRTIATLPSESRFRLPRAQDDVHKPLAAAASSALPGDRIRVRGKGGRAYGFSVECSQILDETNGRSAFVATVIYANDNETINDDRYPYEDVADPFLGRLAQTVARAFLADAAP